MVSTGRCVLCLKFDRYSRASVFHTRRVAARLGTRLAAARETRFFDRKRQKR
jgi:hypothetical protein